LINPSSASPVLICGRLPHLSNCEVSALGIRSKPDPIPSRRVCWLPSLLHLRARPFPPSRAPECTTRPDHRCQFRLGSPARQPDQTPSDESPLDSISHS